MNSNSQKKYLSRTKLPKDLQDFFAEKEEFETIMMMYNCAIREVQTKLEVLNDDLSIRRKRNPIKFIKSRIKTPESIADKLIRRGFDVSVEAVEENLHDVAGIRVVCSFIDDIYDVASMLTKQDDIVLLETKDYIANPKPNGYRSLHLIVEIPVFFSDVKKSLKVEVQIRTIAMDFWASLEHQMKYKRDIADAQEIVEELKQCADVIAATDVRMQGIRKRIN